MPTIKEEDTERSLEDVPMGDDDSVKEEDSEQPVKNEPEPSSDTAMVKTEARYGPSSSIAAVKIEDQGDSAANLPTKWNCDHLGTILGIRSKEILQCLGFPSQTFVVDRESGRSCQYRSFRDYCFAVSDLPGNVGWPCETAGVLGQYSRTAIFLTPSAEHANLSRVALTISDPGSMLTLLSQLGKPNVHQPETWNTTLTDPFNNYRANAMGDKLTWDLGSISVTYTNPETNEVESCDVRATLVNETQRSFSSVLGPPNSLPIFDAGVTSHPQIFGTRQIMAAMEAMGTPTGAQSGRSA